MLFNSIMRPDGIRDALAVFSHMLENGNGAERTLAAKIKPVIDQIHDPFSGLL
jgi:hypothetical protein